MTDQKRMILDSIDTHFLVICANTNYINNMTSPKKLKQDYPHIKDIIYRHHISLQKYKERLNIVESNILNNL